MKNIGNLTVEQALQVRFVLTDIDDTLTLNGRLLPEAFESLWALEKNRITVIPVTGRPAGWCDLISRQWPVGGVVGENGAFAFYLENGCQKQIFHPSIAPSEVRKKLEILKNTILTKIPGSRVAKDQFSRLFDLAVDFNEEPPHLGLDTAEKIKQICLDFGAQAKISSIHVNTWFGSYDKLAMTLLFFENRWNLHKEQVREVVIFCGDSPNDEPMFSFFPLSCAVANITPFLQKIKHEPEFITSGSHGKGFTELVQTILQRRGVQINKG
ncbi:MAG: HAD-IIB family hydrolase [Spirochaetota bacterium]